MFIRDFSWTHEIGYRPEVELKISDVKENEFMNLRGLAANGEKIEIKRKDDPWGDWVSSVITKTETANSYARRDTEMAATLI